VKRILSTLLVVPALVAALAVSSAAETVLTVASWGGVPDTSGFEELHPGVRIEYVRVPGSYNYIEQATVWAVGGALPDVLMVPYWGIPPMADNGVLRDLSDLAAKDPEWMDGFFPGSLEAFTRNGGVYGLPWLVGPMSVVYNPDLFAAQGLPDPIDSAKSGAWTIDRFIEAARKLTRHSADQPFERIGMYSFTNQLHFIAPLVWALGGDIIGDDGETVLVDQPASVRALEELASLYGPEQVFLSRQQLGQYNLNVDQVQYGPATAMRVTWNVEYEYVRNYGVPVDIAPIPTGAAGQPTDLIIAHGIGISSQTQNAELAWEYIKYALSQAPTNLEFPARQEHFARWAQHQIEVNEWDAYEYLTLVTNSIRLAPNPISRDIELIFVRNLDQGLRGQKPITAAVEEIRQQVAARLAEMGR